MWEIQEMNGPNKDPNQEDPIQTTLGEREPLPDNSKNSSNLRPHRQKYSYHLSGSFPK